MLHPREVAFATPDDLGADGPYLRLCQAAGLRPTPDGYGLLLAVDDDGWKHTLVCADVDYVRTIASGDRGLLADLILPQGKFLVRQGWPDQWI